MAARERFLNGKTALVTSASRNLGAVIAETLAHRGARVAVNYFSSADGARALVERLNEKTGLEHVAVQGDTSTGDGVRAIVEGATSKLGEGIDVLVNNSGPFTMTPFVELSETEWDRILDANLKAAYLASQLVAPGMR